MTQNPQPSYSAKDFAAGQPADIAMAAGKKVLVLDADTAVRTPRTAAASTPRAGLLTVAGPRLAALLLGVACTGWAAAPLGGSGLAQTALGISIVAVTAGGLRLALADIPQPVDAYYLPAHIRWWLTFLALLRVLAWEETAVAGMLWLEVQHPARPWHTFALGAGLVAYLLVTHIAEAGAEPGRLLRRQWKVLFAGACLLALGAGFAMLPTAGAGAGTAILRVLAAAAVIAAAALVLPALRRPPFRGGVAGERRAAFVPCAMNGTGRGAEAGHCEQPAVYLSFPFSQYLRNYTFSSKYGITATLLLLFTLITMS